MTSIEIHKLAQTILLSYQGQEKASGQTPSAEDLCALAEGTLTFRRKQEVYGYLNRSPCLLYTSPSPRDS